MKKQMIYSALISFGLMVLVIFNPSSLVAQNNNIKAVLQVDGKAGFSFERALNTKMSVSLGFLAANKTYKSNYKKKHSNIGNKLTGEFRLYTNKENKTLHGLYVAPHFTIGKHELNYYDLNQDGGSGLLGILIDGIDGDFDSNYSPQEKTLPIEGSTESTAASLGLKIGIQQRWDFFNIDFGVNLSKNTVLENKKGIPLNTGEYKAFEKDMMGGGAALYLGLGFAF